LIEFIPLFPAEGPRTQADVIPFGREHFYSIRHEEVLLMRISLLSAHLYE
jgi:hypothetical protein